MKAQWITKFFSALMIVLLAVAVMPVKNVSADDTGWLPPTNVQSSEWANATYGYTSNEGLWATETSDSDDVVYNTFGISIPAGNQIDGIEVSVEGYTSGSRDIDVSLSWTDTGSNWTADTFLNFTDNSASDQTLIAGGSSNTWGRTWTPSEIGVLRVWVETDSDSGTFNLDQIRVRVYYSAVPEIEVYGNGVSITDGDNNPDTDDHTDWGNVGQGIPVTRTFTIVNNGLANLTIGAITFSSGGGLEPTDFSVTSLPASSVAPGGFTTFTIQLTAGAGGSNTRNTVVNIDTNDANEDPFNFAIEGNRIATGPEIEVYGNGVEIDDGDGSSTAAGSNWGDVGQGVPVTRTFTIYNTGAANLTIVGITFSAGGGLEPADFSVVTAPAANVAAGGSTTFTIQLNASAGGSNTRNTVLNIDTNDTSEDPFNFAIEGNRITGVPEIEVLGNNVTITDGGGNTPSISTDTNFGIIPMGSNAVKTYTIRNNGSSILTITIASFAFGSPNFSLLSAPSTPVAAGGSTTFQVQFAPSTTGPINSTITFTNNDPGGEANFTFNLTGIGSANFDSVANDDTATVAEDSGATTINVRSNDTDADSAVELIQSVSDPAGGTVVITNGGADLTYQPDANFCNGGTPTDNFTYTLTGGDTANVAVTVTCVNDISTANDDTATVAEDAAATTINVRGNDSDIDSAVELIQSVSDPAGGAVVITNGGADLTYQPDANFCNGGTPTDNFTYTLAGGDSATVAVTVTCVNDVSTANDDTATVAEEAIATTINVRGNDSDSDSAIELIQSVSDPAGGAVVIINGGADLTYQPDANFCTTAPATDDFTYTLAGGDSATVAVTVTCVNDAPAFTAGLDQTVIEDAGAQTVNWATGISAGPANESAQTLTFIIGNDNLGLFSAGPAIAANGTLTYTPAANANGTANITVTLSDDGGTAGGGVDTSASQIFFIQVNPVDDAPVSSNVTDTTNEDTSQTVTLSYVDAEGDPATLCSVFGVANGSVSTACACLAGVCTVGLTPVANSTTPVTANFTVDNGQVSNTSLITLNVNTVNDPPVTSDVNDTTNEDTEQIITLSYTDTEGSPAASCSVFGLANGSISTPCACAAGICTVGLTPALNSTLQVMASYTVDDGEVSNTSSITLDVTAVDDNPLAAGDNLTIPGATTSILNILSNDTDVDGGTKQVTSVTAASHGTATNNSANISYEPDTGYCGPDTFDYTLNGGSTATVTLDIVCSPAFTSANNASFDFGFPDTFNITATGNPTAMTITMTGAPAGVTLTDNGDGTAILNGDGSTPVGTYSLIFTADNTVDPNGLQNFTLTVRNGPIASNIASLPDTGDGVIIENENISTTMGITQIMVEFDRDVYDDPADLVNFSDDVTNPANYILVRSVTGTFTMTGCTSVITAPEVQVTVNSVTYSDGGGSGPFIATLNINDGYLLSVEGFYKLFVCGTTSIVDAANPGLSLAGDGVNPGTDFVRNFRITAPAGGGDPADDDDNNANARNRAIAASISQGGVLIPVTGFAPQQVTTLPAQTTEYAVSKLTVEIPSISLKMLIVGVEFKDNNWDVTWLGNNAGYLEGSAYPTTSGNTVLTGHATDPNGKPGPFAHLTTLQLGQKIYIHNDGFIYVYDIRSTDLIKSTAIKTLFKHEDDTWLSIVTCENFDAKSGKFIQRRLIRAILISIIPAK